VESEVASRLGESANGKNNKRQDLDNIAPHEVTSVLNGFVKDVRTLPGDAGILS
jgi:hypothetical protein